jgi:uncharacterized membrane protein YgcG
MKTIVTYHNPRSRITKTAEFDEEWRAQAFVVKMRKSGFRIIDVKKSKVDSPKPQEDEPKTRGREIDVFFIDETSDTTLNVTDLADDISMSDTFSGDGGSFSGGGSSDDF